MLLDLVEKMKIKIGRTYREIVSRETIEARPEIQKLLSDVKKGMWKGVLVLKNICGQEVAFDGGID